ncbi:MAG: preprotein translocase subunit YajC [Peptoniphilaceae bacterium]|nr:preprotein translocase subunit YajC [Peptoniphilaceae bacterium]MCI6659328.1 preprotein translocase subunit YajC [Peptoniphilaceae bacterium]MDD7543321.1 preprotein translocase subunit YajC [Peptoniphilaceae bacterium]MDY5765823.1 preprotein translocase subunit YajC [Peptoniphilaceae bacterium]MDY5842697.1 preprotein translocase subunit YajC [Peptoniphilaceae bacterium]
MGEFTRAILASAIVLFAFIALTLIIIQIVNTKRLSKQKKHFEELHKNLSLGQEVLLASGLYGKIKKVSDEYVLLELTKDVEIKASRFSIQSIVKE